MLFPDYRPRRLRQNEAFRRMIRETRLSVDDFILPLFAINGSDVQNPIPSMPGHFQLSVDHLMKTAASAVDLGIPAVMLFGIPESKDPLGTRAYADDGIVQKATRALKDKLPELVVVTDVCLCQYTDHGHCGVVEGQIMMDGRVAEIRDILDENNFSQVPIMSYAAKYCSAYYGPFRSAADSAPQFGDRRTYQMDPANAI
jgi:porphobilinogen synthase